jgi:hypothetical protein
VPRVRQSSAVRLLVGEQDEVTPPQLSQRYAGVLQKRGRGRGSHRPARAGSQHHVHGASIRRDRASGEQVLRLARPDAEGSPQLIQATGSPWGRIPPSLRSVGLRLHRSSGLRRRSFERRQRHRIPVVPVPRPPAMAQHNFRPRSRMGPMSTLDPATDG